MNRNVSFGGGMGLVVAAGILFGRTAAAQPAPAGAPVATPPASVSTNVQDYGQGFRAFIRMGLPDTSKAKYVKLESYGPGMHDMLMYRLHEIQLSGNAWLVSESKDGKSVLVSSTGRTLELFDQKTFMKKQAAEARSNAVAQAAAAGKDGGKRSVWKVSRHSDDLSKTGTWAPVDLSRDLAKATAYVDKKIKAKAAGGREARYDSFLQSDEPVGTLFLLAAFAWQNGQPQEANVLVGRLFALVGDSRKVIVGALNVMADGQLAATAELFQTTHDWKAYHAAVSGLLTKYPVGWRKAGAAKLLADRLQARAALAEPPAVTGEGLTEEDQKLAVALASEASQGGMYGGTGEVWIFPPDKAMRGRKDDSVLGRIKARGIKSVPLLIALVPDETLCPLRRADVGMATYYTSFSDSDSEKSEEERAQTTYNQMDRPLTRGEVARGLLAPLCPRDENAQRDENEDSPEEVAAAAKKTYAILKALPSSALAQHFLNKGDQRQKQAAIGYLLQDDVETNAPVIEAFLLTPPSEEPGVMTMYDNGLVQHYVAKRGEKAAEFVEKYAAMRKKIEVPAGRANNAKYVKQMEKQAEREIKSLRALVKKQDLSETVTALASGDESEGTMAAYTALGRQLPAQAVPALLTAAVQATNVAVRARILQMIPVLRYAGMQESMQEATDPAAMEAIMKDLAEKNKLNIGTNAAAWKILLADTRAMPEGRMYSGGTYQLTVADMAAASIESLYGAASLMEQYGGRSGRENLRPELMMKITRDRAAARLAGKPEDQLPKMPSAEDVTAERRKAIEADVLKAAPAALGPVLNKLTDAEGLYLAELAGEKEAVMKALAPLSRRIVSVKTTPALPAADAARLQKLSGTAVSTNVIAEMREVCKRQLARGAAVAVTLSSGGLGKGLSLDVTPVDEAAQGRYMSGYRSLLIGKGGKSKGMITGMLRSGENYGHGMWLVDVPAAASADNDDSSEDRLDSIERSLESQQEQFEAAAETVCAPDVALGQSTSVSFTGMMPPKPKDKKKGAQGDDEEDADADEALDPFL